MLREELSENLSVSVGADGWVFGTPLGWRCWFGAETGILLRSHGLVYWKGERSLGGFAKFWGIASAYAEVSCQGGAMRERLGECSESGISLQQEER